MQPIALPKAPQRFYYKFQAPIRTDPADVKDREKCDATYEKVKDEVESAISWLLEKREKDPYKDLVPRLAYEVSWGGRTAPTFDP